jgi:glutamyl-tRNA reductase
MEHLFCFAFTHKTTALNLLGKLHIEPDSIQARLQQIKDLPTIEGLMFISTCNRTEFILSCSEELRYGFIFDLLNITYPELDYDTKIKLHENFLFLSGSDVVKHLMEVSSSLDSMLIGEREIITQIRKSYEICSDAGLSDDQIRLVVKACIETAKQVFTDTKIAHKQVSVVALAFEQLKKAGLHINHRIVMIGAGQTNATMAKFLQKFGCNNITIFNRTFENADILAKDVKAKALLLSEINQYSDGFDTLIYCTAAEKEMVNNQLYAQLLNGETDNKVVVDLSIPNGIAREVIESHDLHYINVEFLQSIANENMDFRKQELSHCYEIIDNSLSKFRTTAATRKIELAMQEVPEKVRSIKQNAMNNVFAKDIELLDDKSKEVLEKIFNYVEKRYIAEPMKLAKEILLQKI